MCEGGGGGGWERKKVQTQDKKKKGECQLRGGFVYVGGGVGEGATVPEMLSLC